MTKELAIRAMGTQNTSYTKVNGPAKQGSMFYAGSNTCKVNEVRVKS